MPCIPSSSHRARSYTLAGANVLVHLNCGAIDRVRQLAMQQTLPWLVITAAHGARDLLAEVCTADRFVVHGVLPLVLTRSCSAQGHAPGTGVRTGAPRGSALPERLGVAGLRRNAARRASVVTGALHEASVRASVRVRAGGAQGCGARRPARPVRACRVGEASHPEERRDRRLPNTKLVHGPRPEGGAASQPSFAILRVLDRSSVFTPCAARASTASNTSLRLSRGRPRECGARRARRASRRSPQPPACFDSGSSGTPANRRRGAPWRLARAYRELDAGTARGARSH